MKMVPMQLHQTQRATSHLKPKQAMRPPAEMVATDTENTTNDIMASDENTDTVVEIAGAETANEAVNETINEASDDAEAGSARKGWWRRS